LHPPSLWSWSLPYAPLFHPPPDVLELLDNLIF